MNIRTIEKQEVENLERVFDLILSSGLFAVNIIESISSTFDTILDCTKEDGSVDMIETNVIDR